VRLNAPIKRQSDVSLFNCFILFKSNYTYKLIFRVQKPQTYE